MHWTISGYIRSPIQIPKKWISPALSEIENKWCTTHRSFTIQLCEKLPSGDYEDFGQPVVQSHHQPVVVAAEGIHLWEPVQMLRNIATACVVHQAWAFPKFPLCLASPSSLPSLSSGNKKYTLSHSKAYKLFGCKSHLCKWRCLSFNLTRARPQTSLWI